MNLKRILTLLALCASILECASLAQAQELGGQLNVSLTIVKSCQVASESSSHTQLISSRGCDSSAFQLQDEHGKLLAAPSAREAVTRLDTSDNDSPRVVVYW